MSYNKEPAFHRLCFEADTCSLIVRAGMEFTFYSEVPGLLRDIKAKGVKLAAASRTHAPKLALEMLRLLTIDAGPETPSIAAADIFDALEIYPGNKKTHMSKIHQALGIEYPETLFFDDEERNRNVERELGVFFHHVPNGLSIRAFDAGVEAFREKRKLS